MPERQYGEIIAQLVMASIPFNVEYPNGGGITIHVAHQFITNEQLRTLTELGASMLPNGEFVVLGGS